MNGSSGGMAPPPSDTFVRALYDYEADDRTSLSFPEGDVIQVITKLDSGWWDGMINGVRGWFPSNYCEIIEQPEELLRAHDGNGPGGAQHLEEEEQELENGYDVQYGDEEDHNGMNGGDDHDVNGITTTTGAHGMSGAGSNDKSRADFWIPQATADGRLYYYNTMTGESSMELPLESPSSVTETGPRDRMNVGIPEKTRLPPEMMARGLTQDEDEDSETNSANELEGEHLLKASSAGLARKRRSMTREGVSPAPSMESINGRPDVARANGTYPATMASETSFTAATFNLPVAATIPRSFFDDGATQTLTWSGLVSNMKKAIDRYREAIQKSARSEYVARAEDISDHLRLLLAAGSGTTDNHSGQPSIISTNKALYPHFRDMMSKFSKLVLSSHIAAADWPNAESVQKCLQEAEGVLLSVFSYVEVARRQRGEEIPRLFPGFVIGSTAGGSWQNNALVPRDPIAANFLDDEEGVVEPNVVLDGKLLERLDELKRMLVSSIRELDKNLIFADKIITPYRHEVLGNNVCLAGGKVVDTFKPWIGVIESIDLSPLVNNVQTPELADYSTNKQSLYDNLSDLVLGCQTVAGPLSDEWSEVRGESLEGRLDYVRTCARALEQNSSHMGFSLQLLSEQVQLKLQQQAEQRVREGQMAQNTGRGMPYGSQIPGRPSVGASPSFQDHDAIVRRGDASKASKVLGVEIVDDPEFLKLDYENELMWEEKNGAITLRGGSLPALVEQLTRHDKLESSFNNTFLMTYRSFTTARELFEMLVKRFSLQPPEGLSQAEYKLWQERKQAPIRFRVVNILKSWFETYWMEDPAAEETKILLRDVYTFARETVQSTQTPGSTPLMAVLDQRMAGREVGRQLIKTQSQPPPPPIMPKNMRKLKFLDIDPTEFARQLTLIESALYGKIKATECLNKTWQKKVGPGDPEPAPNVKALILHSNQMTNWVAEMILAQSDVKKRVVVIKHFIFVMDKCRQLNNFSTLTSIMSAMTSAAIARLKRTWEIVPAKTNATLESMRKLMASHKNFMEYRAALQASNPPCIPFFGVYLTDLTFIEDGIPSIIKKTDMINFAKRAKSAEVIRDIQQYQNMPYSLQAVQELQDYILSNMAAAGDVHEMYDKSIIVEPREKEDEKIVRVLTESGFL